MFYDLNVPWTFADDPELARTVSFLDELGYNCIALNYTLTGKIPTKVTCPIPENPFPSIKRLRILTRITVILDDHAQNYGLPQLTHHFDIVALRPTTEKLLMQACSTLEADLISLDSSIRHPYYFKPKVVNMAISRGIQFEINYSTNTAPSNNNNEAANARRNVISNAMNLIRATKGKGIIISSEARRAANCRAPFDVINLASMWGLSQERGQRSVVGSSADVVAQAKMRRSSYRGVINLVDAGGFVKAVTTTAAAKDIASGEKSTGKRKKGGSEDGEEVAGASKEKDDSSKQDAQGSALGTPTPTPTSTLAKRPSKKQRLKDAKRHNNNGEAQDSSMS